MKKYYLNVILIAGVVALLLLSGCVSGIVSISQSTTTNASQQKDTVTSDDAGITCYVGGIPHSQTISYESGTYLKELFSALAYANARDPCSAETHHLQQQILLYTEQQGLLPEGMSANMVLAQLDKHSQNFAARNIGCGQSVLYEGKGQEMFCNFVSTGEGSAFPIIILPRLIPLIMTPIPRLFVGWKTPSGITSVGGLVSRTGFIAAGQQQGLALGFWGIGFSIFLPPVMGYGMFGYALYAKVTAEYMEYWPPNNPPELTAVYPIDGATYVPLSTTELQFHISDLDNELMSYSAITNPDIGGGNGNMKTDGTYTIPVSGLKSLTKYSWTVSVSDGLDTTEQEFSFTTEGVAPIISEVTPMDGETFVPITTDYLRFYLRDPQNDPIDYTVETSPAIGSGSGTDVGAGYITIFISNLQDSTIYHWFVNATDGTYPTAEEFWFQTEPLMVFDPFAEGWEYRKMITINHTMVAGDLEYFSVLLDLTDLDLRDKAQEDGDDLLFMDGTGVANRLFHEIELFNDSNGELVAWVKIPALSESADTVLYMYYGNSTCSSQQYLEQVWDSDYIHIWHLGDSLVDSSGSNDGTNHGTDIELGKIGDARDFEQSEDDYIVLGDMLQPGDGSLTTITWEGWIKPESLDMAIASKYDSSGPDLVSYYIGFDSGGKFRFNAYSAWGVYTIAKTVNSYSIIGQWVYLTGTFNLGGINELHAYINGDEVDFSYESRNANVMWDISVTDDIGRVRFEGGPQYSDAVIDEMRWSNVVRSDDWIKTSYNTMNDPSSFLSIDPEESAP